MSARAIRRAAERKALKVARKAGFPIQQPTLTAIEPEPTTIENIPEPGFPFPSLAAISPARLPANRSNAECSTEAVTSEGRSICAQNHTIHRLARHENGNFKILSSENSNNFETLKQSLTDEHQPATPTESILVNSMAESYWLASRAQRLQDGCMDPDTGAITDDKKFSLYMRYQTTHTRAFHKALNDLLKLRSEKRKAELGVEAQRIQNEKHEMKKQTHYWEVLKRKGHGSVPPNSIGIANSSGGALDPVSVLRVSHEPDAEACHQISTNTIQNLKAHAENPGFDAEYAAELASRRLENTSWEVASEAA